MAELNVKDFVRLPRLSTRTSRILDPSDAASRSGSPLDGGARREALLRFQAKQSDIKPLQVALANPYTQKMKRLSTRSESRESALSSQSTRREEARVEVAIENEGIFVCELDREAMDGSLQRCIAGELYSFGVSLKYGYGNAKVGTDIDREMMEQWLVKQGGINAFLTGPKEISCTCTHVAQGAYAFTFSSSLVGQYQLWIFVGKSSVGGSPFPVRILPGPAKGRSCHVTGLGLWSAKVGMEASFEWAAKDSYGNKVEQGGDPFLVAVLGPDEIPVEVIDHKDGSYRAAYTPTIAGQYRISITLHKEHLAGSPFLVSVHEATADASMSTVSGDGLEDCHVGEDRHFLIEALDRYGNRVMHGDDKFVADLEGPGAEKVHLIDMDDGTYAGMYMCRWSGDFKLHVLLDGTPVAESPFDIHVRPGPTYPPNCECTLVKLPMTRLLSVAGTLCSFTIFAKDRFGNRREEGGDDFAVRCRSPTDTVNAVIKDNKDGSYVTEFRCFKEGDYFIEVKLGKIDIQGSPFVLTVDPSSTFAMESMAEGIENEFGNGLKIAQAGRPVQFRIHARDEFGNVVRKPGDDFQVRILEVQEGIRVRAKVMDNGNGTYEVTWTGMIRGEYDIHVALKDEPIKGSPWKAVVRTGNASAEKCTAEGSGLGGSSAGVPNSILVESNDHFGNIVTNGGAKVEGVLVSLDGSLSIACEVADHEDGTYTVTYAAKRSSEYFLAVRVDGEHIHESPFLIFVDHTVTDASQCMAEGKHEHGDGLKYCSVGDETGFQIFAFDTFGNRCTVGGDSFYAVLKGEKDVNVEILDHQDGHYTCSYTALWSGQYQLHVTLNGQDIQGSPWGIEAIGAEIHPPSCYIHGPGIYATVAGKEADLHVQAKDKYENIRQEEDPIEVHISGPEKVTILRRYLGEGQYDFFWTANSTGVYEVDISCHGESLGTAPYSVNVGPGPIHPLNCIATGDGLHSGMAGIPNIFVINSKDMFGNARTHGGDKYSLSISGPTVCEAKVRDQENGRYTVTWSTLIKGSYWIQITLNGEEISGSPYLCEISPSYVDVEASQASGMGLLSVATFKDSSFTIHSYDKYGNHLDKGGDSWEVSIVGVEVPEVSIQDNDDGTYLVRYQSTVKGVLQVYVGMKGRELVDSPFEVYSDSKVRRKLAQEKAAKLASKQSEAEKRRDSSVAIMNEQVKKVGKKKESDEEESTLPTRGMKILG